MQTAVVSHCVSIPAACVCTHHAGHSTWGEGRHVSIGGVGQAGKAESTRSAGVALSGAKGEVTVAVSIGSGWGNTGWVQDIGVH